MTSLSAPATPAFQGPTSSDLEAFVAAVVRSHESVLRNLRRLAAGVAWPVESDARRDREIIDSYEALYK
jgi:hypothetical protein